MVTRRGFMALTGGAILAGIGGMAIKHELDAAARRELLRSLAGRVGADPRRMSGTREAFAALVKCGRRTLYVSGSGSDTNSGSKEAPFREINRAVGNAQPGDLIVVGPGRYGYTEVRGFHGEPDAWLGIMASGKDALITVPPPTDNFVNIVESSYVGLFGFEIAGDQNNPNTNNSGLSVYGDSHHVVLWNNHVHDFPGGGINCFDVGGSHDLLDIRYNRIHGTSRYSPENTSGISIYASRDLTQGEVFPDGYGVRLVGNYIHDVLCTVPFTRGGFDYVTDGNGISLDLVKATYGYTKPILVENNIVTGCGGRALHAYGTINIDAVRNTAVGNLRTDSPAISGRAEMDGTVDDSVRFMGNVICPLHTDSTTDRISTYQNNLILGGSQSVPAGNYDFRDMGLDYFAGPVNAVSLVDGADPGVFRARDF